MRTRLAIAFVVAVALSLLAAPEAQAKETMLDDFESPSGVSKWTFYNGMEFPGATGSLAAGTGHTGKGAVLAYDLSAGGHYVSASLSLSPPVTAAVIGFWAKVPPGIHATLRVVDTSGQTLQYDVSRPLEAFDPTAWFHQFVELDAPSSHFGGANDGAVHQPVTAVTVLAADPLEPGAKGSLAFDDVIAIDELATRIDPRAPVTTAAPPGAADLASRLGVNVHFTQDDRALDLASQAGFTFVRMDLGWGGFERTKGKYDFTAQDALVASLAQRGMGLLLILDYFNPLYPGADSSDFATTTVPAFAAMTRAVAQHFGGKNVRFEVWNEPNLDGFWPPKADASQYGVLSKAAIAAAHQGNAAAQVSTAGLSQFDIAFLRGYVAEGGADGANAIGVHPYRQTGPESVSDSVLLFRDEIAPLASKPPAWSTEWGYSSAWYGDGHAAANLGKQARFAVRELSSAWAVGFPVIVYYDVRDDGTNATDPENNFGLLANDYSAKPAYTAVRTLSDFVKGRTFRGFFEAIPSSLHALALSSSGWAGAVVWLDAPGGVATVVLPAGVQVKGMLGDAVTPAAQGADAILTIREMDGPVYLSIPVATNADAGSDAATGGAGNGGAGNGGVTGTAGSTSASGGGGGAGPFTAGGAAGAAGATSGNGAGRDAGTPGTAGSRADAGAEGAKDSASCGCSLPGHPGGRAAWLVAALAGACLVRRFRRGFRSAN
jgi:hypothetical protein